MSVRNSLTLSFAISSSRLVWLGALYPQLDGRVKGYRQHFALAIRSASYWHNCLQGGYQLRLPTMPLVFDYSLPDMTDANRPFAFDVTRSTREALEDMKEAIGTHNDSVGIAWVIHQLARPAFRYGPLVQVTTRLSNGSEAHRFLLSQPPAEE